MVGFKKKKIGVTFQSTMCNNNNNNVHLWNCRHC
jgi:hypothetical protein